MPRKPRICNTPGCDKLTRGTNCRGHAYKLRTKHVDKKAYQREWHLLRKYDLSEEDFFVLWIAMQGTCPICKQQLVFPAAQRGQAPNVAVVDHNHQTGNIRGLLCNNCNKGIGLLKDSPEVISRALNWAKNVN